MKNCLNIKPMSRPVDNVSLKPEDASSRFFFLSWRSQQGAIPRKLLQGNTSPTSGCSCFCTMYHGVINGDGRHWPNLWGKNPEHCSCSCSSVWWKCNSCPYFGGKLVSAFEISNPRHKKYTPKPTVCCLCYFKIQGNWEWEHLQPSMNILDLKMSLNCLEIFLFLFPQFLLTSRAGWKVTVFSWAKFLNK